MEELSIRMMRKQTKKILKKHWMEFVGVLLVFVIGATVIFPSTVKADDLEHPTDVERQAINLMVHEIQNSYTPYGSFPQSQMRTAPRTMTVTATAYTSDVWQTDATPFITASGTTVRDGVVAANFLPIGTKVKIPDKYGDQIFVVEDRMNARYSRRLDIWMDNIEQARRFGVQKIDIEIYQ